MNAQLATVNEQELAQKRTAWGTFGEAVYKTEISIQNKASQQIGGLWLPGTIEQIADAEVLLKQLKAGKLEVQTARKAITSKTDALTSRLMEPEKSFDEPIKVLEQAIIKIKKEHEAVEAKKIAKLEERKQIIETIKNAVAGCDANYKTIVNNKVDAAFKYALGDGNIQPADKQEYLRKCRVKVSESTFPIPTYNVPSSHHTIEEIDALKHEYFIVDRSIYVVLHADELEKKFSDFDVAFHNKVEALQRAEEEKKQKEAEILQQQEQQQMAAKLESVSESIDTTPSLFTKALKKSYEVDMPETIESVLAIQGAFAANIKLCLPKLSVKKWFSFTPAQAATALSKVKCDDNNFQPTGITFKEVDKL
jgi:hypothetical protein